MRNLGGAIGIAVCATLLNNRTNLHFFRMAEHLNYANEALNAFFSGAAGRIGTSDPDIALHALWQMTYREAQTMAYSDTFLVIMVAFMATTLFVPLMKKAAAPSTPSADAH